MLIRKFDSDRAQAHQRAIRAGQLQRAEQQRIAKAEEASRIAKRDAALRELGAAMGVGDPDTIHKITGFVPGTGLGQLLRDRLAAQGAGK